MMGRNGVWYCGDAIGFAVLFLALDVESIVLLNFAQSIESKKI